MITILTGLPGNGKTLRALEMVEALCRKDNRPLFVMGIKFTDAFPIPWEKVPPVSQWTELRPIPEDPSILAPAFTFPENAVILIDESQMVFRPRATSAAVPPHVAAFETHRHEGIDFVLLTQHPMLLDSNIRRLTNRHIHMVRAFGAEASFIHEWQQVKENCDKIRNNSQVKPWRFPKHIYTWYVSAKAHTYKFRPPLRALLLIVLPILLLALGLIFFNWVKERREPKAVPASSSKAPSPSFDQVPTDRPVDWLASFTPRVPGLPHTAPRYEQVTTPFEAPAPVGCSLVADRCRCYSSQGTVLNISHDICRGLVDTGFFKDWAAEGAPINRKETR